MSKPSLSVPLPAPSLCAKVPLSKPLRHARFRHLWTANLISNLGTWTQTFASAWLVACVASSASTASLVQTASYIPIFLFALFAGVIADAVHRPKFLFFCNLFMALCACAMAALAISGRVSTAPVLALTFCMGTGAAFMWPAWQASMSGLVEPDEVEAAATLNNLSYNVAAILGPALGGLLFNWVGAGALFLVNALSFVGLLTVYWSWWRDGVPEPRARVDFASSLKLGLRTALGCGRYRRILLNVCTVFFATIAFAALLPVFVRQVLQMDSSVFGILMGSLGAGAVCGAFLLPSLRTRVGKTRLLSGSLLVYGAMLCLLPFIRSLALLVPLIVAAGMAWSATVSTLNAAAQLAFPASIRARTLSIYLFVMAGGYTIGSVVWGALADRVGVQAALATAGACVIVNAIALATGKRETSI
ncbi:MFS transporter [Massilia pseudoviolaceinigra]|uniref:MFS transporter n=1 Tax=Massilia pseudoviolaceinigra TaxID=3057165 RepID=UPI0027964983|nr:MFS transporter [Massilia sp. CCM 9206]MDQ1922442.1 MFS transporter [Massilia sp. CCM 9206]